MLRSQIIPRVAVLGKGRPFCAALVLALLWSTAMLCSASPALAQAGTGSLVGTVKASDGTPLAGATVALRGVSNQVTTTDAHGHYQFGSVPPGLYQLIVTRPGFFQTITNVAVSGAQTVTTNFALSPQSFESLRTIAHVSTNALGYAQINQSSAAISTIPSATFQEQGQTQVMNVLNEIPGITVWQNPSNGNGTDQEGAQSIQIRGALPYETESLIDGHATPLSLSGAFDPSILNPAVLQSVEIVKGPGSEPAEINYAIGGTVNFITLQPTLTPQAMLSQQFDSWGGLATSIRVTGSTPSRFLQYAFAYATDGEPGGMRNYPVAGSAFSLTYGGNYTINGQELVSSASGIAPASEASYNQYIGFFGQYRNAEPFYICCSLINTSFDSKNQLGKVRLNFSQTTSLTLSFLGAQDFGATADTAVGASLAPVGTLPDSSWSSFTPPAGYSGSVPAGTQIPFDFNAYAPFYNSVQEYLYQGELRTTFGAWTLLARYYDGGNNQSSYLATGPGGLITENGNTWGGGLVCPKGTTYNGSVCNPGGTAPYMEYFNGQYASFSATDANVLSFINNHELGETVQLIRPFNNGSDLTVSLDRHSQSGYEYYLDSATGEPGYDTLPPGASQLFDTESARFDFFVAPKVMANVADYAIQYESHFTDNGGGLPPGSGPASWQTATRGYNAPRIAFTWQPNDDTSWRLALGSSIAPPFLSLLSSPGSLPTENIAGVPTGGYTEDVNSGDIAPETAFSYDIGVDQRLKRSMFVSVDAYLTNLRNMYLPSTFLVNPDYFPPGCPAVGECPLYASGTENLGHARYEGVEVSLGNAPISGFGFKLNGDLMRAYAYDLPPGFYCTNVPANQCTPYNYNTNLGILPGVNFQQGTGIFYNTINGASVPYSSAYAELNYRTLAGAFFRAGWTYYGNNNQYSVPAFGVVSAGITEPVGSHADLQLTAINLNHADSALYGTFMGGIPIPLAPECVGKYGTPAEGATGTACTALVNSGAVPRSDVSVVSQEGLTASLNYGPTTFQLQLVERIGDP